MSTDISSDPIFVHSLWRAGSTYMFQAFRRSPAGYWAYQEPVHEAAHSARNNPDILTSYTSEALSQLRHPHLDQPYFYELQQVHKAWCGVIEKGFIYDDYFGASIKHLCNYFRALISAAKGRPVIQECRTASRIGAIKEIVGGTHLYLWRNPWDQWWSLKVNEYFNAACQIILNANVVPPVILRLRGVVGYTEFHDDSIDEEFRHFQQRPLSADDSYLVFYTLWCLGLLEGQSHADLVINIDHLSNFGVYRQDVANYLQSLGILEVDLSDCHIPQGYYDQSNQDFFKRVEAQSHGLLLTSGYAEDTVYGLKKLRDEYAPTLRTLDVTNDALARDLQRVRGIVLRRETSEAEQLQNLYQTIEETQAHFLSKVQQVSVMDERLQVLNLELQHVQAESAAREHLSVEQLKSVQQELVVIRSEAQRDMERLTAEHQAVRQALFERERGYAAQLADQQAKSQQALEDAQQAHERREIRLVGEIETARRDYFAVIHQAVEAAHAQSQAREVAMREDERVRMDLLRENYRLASRIGAMQSTWWWRLSMPFRRASRWAAIFDPMLAHAPAATPLDSDTPAPSGHGIPDSRTLPPKSININQGSHHMPIQHIIELFALEGRDFITEAYRNLLDREPDPQGMAYYLGRLAMGYGKARVIMDLAQSKEAHPHHEIVGLAKLIQFEKRANHWLWGLFFRHRRRERLVRQQVSQITQTQGQCTIMQLSNDMQAMKCGIVRISHEIEGLEQDMRRSAASIESKGPQLNKHNRIIHHEKTISKILHRVYFDNFSPFYDPFLHYLETWKRELPNYQVMKWGARTIDTSENEWLRRSADANDPVFLSEFVRWDVLKKYGGVYLDADCEVLDDGKFDALVDELNNSTDYDAFLGVEEFYNGYPTAQTIAAKKGSDLVSFMYDMYVNNLSSPLWYWRSERGLIGPQLISLYFRQHGLEETKGFPIQLKEPVIVGRVKIYPQEFFSPKFTTTGKKMAVSDNTCIYHLFANLNVKEVDPEVEKHRRSPLLFSEYCDYLANLNDKEKFVKAFIDHDMAGKKSRMRDNGLRKLHRIYFGFDGKPDPYKRYLETWVKQMPGYEICHWDATNLPINNCHFSRMMFEFKDYAFLSDYFRWWVMREHGGMYLDADVEILNGQLLDKLIMELDIDSDIHAAIGIDSKTDGWYTAHSVACKKNSHLAQFMCEIYEGLGHLSLWRQKIFYFMAPQMTSLFFATHGWNVDGMGSSPNLQTPVVVEGVKIYPQEWFSPMRPQMKDGFGSFEIDSYTRNTCICHHFSCSWHPDDSPYKSNSNDINKHMLLDELINIGAK